MQLVTNAGKNQNHLSVLKAIIDGAEEVVICSGWMKICGLKQILPSVDQAIARGSRVLIYTNAEHTDVDCVKELTARPGLTHVNVTKPYLHSKLYYGRSGDSFRVMVGSANVTAGGLLRNEELSHAVSGNTSDLFHEHYVAYIKKLSGLLAA